jgi:antitoxin MazE
MLVSVIRIGNSKGIRLPKALLEQCEIDDAVELEVKGKEIVLRPAKRRPREGWAAAFESMTENGDDELAVADSLGLNAEDWEW